MTRSTMWPGQLIVALIAVGLGSSGCAGATATRPQSVASSATSDPLVKYAQCMRSNGVPGFPDPVNGKLIYRMTKGSSMDPASPQYQAAQQVCQSLEPAGLRNPAQNPQQQAQMLRFVACMRKNGVPKFPDPQPDGHLLLDPSSGIDPSSAQFTAAQAACQKLQPGGGPAAP